MWVWLIFGFLLVQGSLAAHLGLEWLWVAIAGSYLLGIAGWMLLERQRRGYWIGTDGYPLPRVLVLISGLLIAVFLTFVLLTPMHLFGLWFSLATLACVFALCVAYEWQRRKHFGTGEPGGLHHSPEQ